MSSTITPNMNLIAPTVGSEPGPEWAYDINDSLTLVDQHDHSPGKGVQITPAGLNINTDLSFNGNFATDVAGVEFATQTVTPDVLTIYASGVDLYYVDGLGNNIRMTQSGGVAGTPGSIANLVPPASATYVAGNKTFVWQSGVGIAANMDAANYVMRNITPNSTFALTLAPPAALSQNYQVTLPTLPASTSVMTIGSTGVISSIPLNTGIHVPTGSVIAFGGTSIPSGYLLCDGTSYTTASQPGLYAVIGDNFGGDGGTNFNVPDLRGIFIRGVDSGAGRDPNAASRTAMNPGGNGGDNVGSIQEDAFQDHIHRVQGGASASIPPYQAAFNSVPDLITPVNYYNTSGQIGGNSAGETRPKNAYLYYIIKA